MIRYTQGNLLEASTDALINTVNEVGVMGKGIALMFRESFPENARAYEAACKSGEVHVGTMFVIRERDLTDEKWIINFPTKKHWRHPSKLEWIQQGLKDLARVIQDKQIRSIAIPPLGCGNGGLPWSAVKQAIELELSHLDVDIVVFEPTTKYQNAIKKSGANSLTPARALIIEFIRRYSVLGLDCTNLEVQKLGWFLHRVIRIRGLTNVMSLKYEANKFGPYADNLRHLLDGLDGSYLHCDKRLSDAGPMDAIWCESSRRDEVQNFLQRDECKTFVPAIDEASQIIDGFESPMGMELLATVDWIVSEMNCEASLDGIKKGLKVWPGGVDASRRKRKIFDDRLLLLALGRLDQVGLTNKKTATRTDA